MLPSFATSSVFQKCVSPKKTKKMSLNATHAHTDGFHSLHRLRGHGETSSEMGVKLAERGPESNTA